MDRVGPEFIKIFWCWSDLRFVIFLRAWSGASPRIPEKIMSTCGWLYAPYGVNTDCPKDYAAAGFCGVNNKGDCPQNTFFGIQCCKFN